MSAAETLRTRHAARFDALLRHPFFIHVEEGRLTAGARDRYFVAERHFVGAARRIFALLLSKAPDIAAARHLVGILDGLVNAQEPLFDRIYADLGLADPPAPSPAAARLAGGMIAISQHGPYAAGIAAMGVAEWSYADVARRDGWRKLADPTLREWFRLHAEPSFQKGAQWLSAELDRTWSPETAGDVDAAFAQAIELEIGFHAEPLQ